MINAENLFKMYDVIIENNELTTQQLNGCGFNSKDLADLIDRGFLKRVKRGYYSFLPVDRLYHYGKNLITLKEFDHATACFEKCYQLAPHHLETTVQLFLRAINRMDYSKAFEYFEHFYTCNYPITQKDSRFYLYLLNIITNIPEQFSQVMKDNFEQLQTDINNEKDKDSYIENNIRSLSVKQKFHAALNQLNESIEQKGSLTINDMILRTLLLQASNVQRNSKQEVIQLIKAKQYDLVVSYLEKRQKRNAISYADNYILAIAKDLIQIDHARIFPIQQIDSTTNLFEAIKGKNYPLAFSLSNQYVIDQNIEPNDNAINLLLAEIIERITNPVSSFNTLVDEMKNFELSVDLSSLRKNYEEPFLDILDHLICQDFNQAFKIIRDYLARIDKSQYQFLLIDLIKISLIEKDFLFTKLMSNLTKMNNQTFSYCLGEYIQYFYETLVQNRMEEARIYLDIIKNSKQLGQPCEFEEGLEKIFHKMKKTPQISFEAANFHEMQKEKLY